MPVVKGWTYLRVDSSLAAVGLGYVTHVQYCLMSDFGRPDGYLVSMRSCCLVGINPVFRVISHNSSPSPRRAPSVVKSVID